VKWTDLVLVQDDESLEHMRVGKVLLGRQLGSLRRSDPDWRLMRDEPRDPARLSGLTDNVHRLMMREKEGTSVRGQQLVKSLIEDERWGRTSPTRVVTCIDLSSSSRVMKKRGYIADTRK
jgi:hypothetical protein